MAQKYMILKVITRNFSNKTNKGFTLIELIVGLSIMLIIGGLAMNALIQASTSFNKDKRSIDSSQNLSAILEIIGSDIRQSGENINDSNFPVIEFVTNTDYGSMANSSKIIVRRALTSRLTLCGPLVPSAAISSIIVADNSSSTVTASSNCDVGTSSNPLSVYRVDTTVTAPLLTPATSPVTPQPTITTYYPQAASGLNPYPTLPEPLDLKLPLALRKVRDYRCNIDPNINYDSAANAGWDSCGETAAAGAKLRIAVSSSDGQLLIFNQTDEVANVMSDTTVNPPSVTTSTKRYSITVNRNFEIGNSTAVPPIPADTAIANNIKNSASTVNYNIGDPIYVIDERVYTLASNGDFRVSANGAPPEILIKKIANFRVSAKTYTNSTDRIVQPTPAADVCADAFPFAAQPTTGSESSPKYICKFNYFDTVGPADRANWKTLAGIKVEIQTKYDGTGQDAEAANPLLDSAQVKESKKKLYAVSEFFPRNVLSK